MSLTKLFPVLAAAAFAFGATAQPAQAQGTITDIDLEGLDDNAEAGLLTATGGTVEGTFAGLPFTTDVEDFGLQLLADDGNGGGCSILNLELAPIELNGPPQQAPRNAADSGH